MSPPRSANRSTHPQSPDTVRLQKLLAAAGVGSRRNCEEYILAGRVMVDGEVVTELGTTVDPDAQRVELDGERIKPQALAYYLLNKPPGCLCTNSDPSGRPRAIDLVPDDGRRLFTVGRLDENSQGLLLVTNDGDLAQKLAHPRFQVLRTYEVQVAGRPTPEDLSQLKQGIRFSDGVFRVRGVKRIRTQGKSTFLELELTQGRNREIRRLLARIGHKVMALKRITFGPLRLGRLPLGKSRPLLPAESKALQDFAAGRTTAPRARTGKSGPRKTRRPADRESSPSRRNRPGPRGRKRGSKKG